MPIGDRKMWRNISPIGDITYIFRKEIHGGGVIHLYADKVNAKDVQAKYLLDEGDLLGIPFE